MHIGTSKSEKITAKDLKETRTDDQLVLRDSLHSIRWELIHSAIKADERGQALPKLDLSPGMLGRMLEREGIPLTSKVTLIGVLSNEESEMLRLNGSAHVGLRSGYKIEHKGETKWLLLNGAMTGGHRHSCSLYGASPSLRVILQPGMQVKVSLSETKSESAPTLTVPSTVKAVSESASVAMKNVSSTPKRTMRSSKRGAKQ